MFYNQVITYGLGRKIAKFMLIPIVLFTVFQVSAAGNNVYFGTSSLEASPPISENVTKVVLRVMGPNGKLQSFESNGTEVVFDASSAPNGSYNYHTWVIVEDQDGNRRQVSAEQGRFKVVNGQIQQESDGAAEGDLGFFDAAKSSSVLAHAIEESLDFFFPAANAQNIEVDSTSPTIEFEDTSAEGTDTDGREWLLQGNDSSFRLFDDSNDAAGTNITSVLRIDSLGSSSATTRTTENSIEIEGNGDMSFQDGAMFLSKAGGKLGLGTITPGDGIHAVSSGKQQFVRLENTSHSTWQMGQADTALSTPATDGDFQIRVLTNGNGGPTGTLLSIPDQTGNVGINTASPTSKLTVAGTNDARVAVINSDISSVTSRVMVNLVNNGAPVVQMNDTSSGLQWNFRTGSGGRFVADSPGGNNPQMQVFQNGNMSITGTLTQGSSRTYKDDLVKVDESDILAKLRKLNVSEWSYKSEVGTDTSKRVRHLGPMAEDFYALFGLGANEKGIASLDTAGVALAAIKSLSSMVDEKSAVIDSQHATLTKLEQENKDLNQRLEQLEKFVFSAQEKKKAVAVN